MEDGKEIVKPLFSVKLCNGKFVAGCDDDEWDDRVWNCDFKCPECGHEEYDVECHGKYAPIVFCSICGCQMNRM